MSEGEEKFIPKKIEVFVYDYPIREEEEEVDFAFGEEPDVAQALAVSIVEAITEEKTVETPEWRGAGEIYEGTTVVGDSCGAEIKTQNYNYGAYIEYFKNRNVAKINLFQQKRKP